MSGYQNDPGTVQQEAGFGFNGRYWTESYSDGLTAHAGGLQPLATQLASMVNTVATVATAGDSVQLPIAQPGLAICVVNTATNALQVFAQNGSSDTINGIAGSTGIPVIGKSVVWFQSTAAGAWTSQGVGYGNYTAGAYALDTVSTQTGVTAHATGGQANATQLTASQVQVSTVASLNDSVKLPPSQAGLQITIVNNGANSMQVFGTGSDTINGVAAGTGVAQAAAAVTIYYCFVAGNWVTK
ncbi:MAG TPA: hypothetical protein VN306_17260 [Mycobacterium sp.]|nr:hypothetical protein [Mycobacterium sp.]